MRLSTRQSVLLFIGIAILLVGAAFTGDVHAQGTATPPTPTLRPVSDNEVNQVARNLYCPVCQNVPLEVCETEACARWREQVRDLLAQGYTEAQVRQYFIERFGTKTVGTPSDPLSQFLTIVLPFGLIALIGVVIVISLVRWRTRRPVEAPENLAGESSVTADDYRARLEEEIRKRG